MNILDLLNEISDKEYASFSAKLTPSVDSSLFLGVRVPDVRNLAKKIKDTPEAKEFLKSLPHRYYDENMLHGLLLSEIKDYDECVEEVDRFLPFVDNWAVCDIMSPRVFKKNKRQLIKDINRWVKSKDVYACRFGIQMLMSHFLDDDFEEGYLSIPASVHSEEYYINMMIAWFFATALAKQWDSSIKYILNNCLDEWVHNKTIQKARESFRISSEKKEYLKSLKR